MTELNGQIRDTDTGQPLEARVRVVASTGESCRPQSALRKVGTGPDFFYSTGTFSVDVPRGQVDILVERGTEYRALHVVADVSGSGVFDLDLPLNRWTNMATEGWYAGNTHVHYDETESRAAERLRQDPRVEDLPVFIVSRLQRRQLAYASNAFPIGGHEATTPEHVIDVGEETRHNSTAWTSGYGHVMLIHLREPVDPLSRGALVADASPDYPPLIDACATARAQGGLALWCHNGDGMEAPIAAALGILDGFNLFDPYWMDPEYDIWYALLNCGMRLPASTGSDWFVCSSNRVYVDAGDDFSYRAWLDGLRAGRTFVTDGPILRLSVDGHQPSNLALARGPRSRRAMVELEWSGARPLTAVEIVRDGVVVARQENASGSNLGTFRARIEVSEAGWLAARAWGRDRNTYDHALWAHTSPVYLRSLAEPGLRRSAANGLVVGIDRALAWIANEGRFESSTQRDRMLDLFREGRSSYAGLAR